MAHPAFSPITKITSTRLAFFDGGLLMRREDEKDDYIEDHVKRTKAINDQHAAAELAAQRVNKPRIVNSGFTHSYLPLLWGGD